MAQPRPQVMAAWVHAGTCSAMAAGARPLWRHSYMYMIACSASLSHTSRAASVSVWEAPARTVSCAPAQWQACVNTAELWCDLNVKPIFMGTGSVRSCCARSTGCLTRPYGSVLPVVKLDDDHQLRTWSKVFAPIIQSIRSRCV